jgi:CRISPR-associated endonuclease/helicase Cas3
MSLQLNRLWGKLGNQEYTDGYHPLICHMIDVGVCAQEIWDRIPRSSRSRLATQLAIQELDARRFIGFMIAAHDIGKAIPGFQTQGKTEELRETIKNAGFSFGVGETPFHAAASVPILLKWLESRGFAPTLRNRLAYAVGGHHGTFPTDPPQSDNELGNSRWRDHQKQLLDHLATVFEVPNTPPSGGTDTDQSSFLFLAGLTTVADWLGSNTDWFPQWGQKSIEHYHTHAKQQAGKALDEIKWPIPETNDPHVSFEKVFSYLVGKEKSFEPRPLQNKCKQIVQGLDVPALLLVEAPMGEGKTEAALFIADWWRRRTGAGAYIALPTMATSNGMFSRVEAFLDHTIPHFTQLHLLHGQALLSDNYDKLKGVTGIHDNKTEEPHGVMAHAWFAAQKKQAILAPYGVGTIDQALLAVLQTKHFFLRLFGLAGKTVILDEVHAYDTYMSTLMELLLKWLSALGCPVVLLSATLPSERRNRLIRAYAGDDAEQCKQETYPRVTWATRGGPIHGEPIEAARGRDQVIRLEHIDDTSLAVRLKSALSEGGCACVIRNTVGKAQETYLELKNAFEGTGIKLMLFHARFLFGRRADIEKEVLRHFGKDGPRPEKMVLVATQVVEQSLDLDFDLMATDIAPVDLILQRSGRLHRHRERVRPKNMQSPTLWLIPPGVKDGRPDFGKYQILYGRYLLLRTWEELQKKDLLRLPQEIEKLVEVVYSKREETQPDFVSAKELDTQEEEGLKKKAEGVLAPEPVMNRNFWRCWNASLGEDEDPTTHQSRRAATRDVEPTVQLIVTYLKDGREFLEKTCHTPMVVEQVLLSREIDHMKAILKNAVAVSHPGCFHHYAKLKPPNGWAKNGLLKFYRLVRVGLDGISLTPDEYPLSVDDEIGIRFTREQLEI